jgi:DNA mismatch endonuclease (patch repair protein)
MVDTFTKSERSRIMAAVKSKDTAPELLVRRLVHSLGYRYRLHVRTLPGTPDLVFSRLSKIINVNGCFWHMHGCGRCHIPSSRTEYWTAKLRRNAERDKRTGQKLRQGGWRVMVIWECQITPSCLDRLRARIVAFLDKDVKRPSRKSSRGDC